MNLSCPLPEITSFTGPWKFLSNFFPSPVKDQDGRWWQTIEHAYQASKTLDPEEKDWISMMSTPGKAKLAGRRVKLRPDWDSIKDSVMLELVREKFRDPILQAELLKTFPAKLIEVNHWMDRYWGVGLDGIGLNKLGEILMTVRGELVQVSLTNLAPGGPVREVEK